MKVKAVKDVWVKTYVEKDNPLLSGYNGLTVLDTTEDKKFTKMLKTMYENGIDKYKLFSVDECYDVYIDGCRCETKINNFTANSSIWNLVDLIEGLRSNLTICVDNKFKLNH